MKIFSVAATVFCVLMASHAAAHPGDSQWRVEMDAVQVESTRVEFQGGEVLTVPCPDNPQPGRPFALFTDDGVRKGSRKEFVQDINIVHRVRTDMTCFAATASYPADLNLTDRRVTTTTRLYDDQTQLWTGNLSFDIHTQADNDSLRATIQPVRLSSKSTFPIWLWNDSDFSLTITRMSVETAGDSVWTVKPVPSLGCDSPRSDELIVPPKTPICIALGLQPSIFSALAATATQGAVAKSTVLKSSGRSELIEVAEHELTITLDYVVEGAYPKSVTFRAPVRFKPGLYQLLFAL